MALIRSLPRIGPAPVEPTATHMVEPDRLPALSQNNLDALGLPLAYVDRHRRYRFVNRAFLEWTDRRQDEVIGHEVCDVVGKDVYQYRDRGVGFRIVSALSRQRTDNGIAPPRP